MPIDFRDNRPMTDRREMVLRVGQGEGDIQGRDDKALQAGADYLHRLGGGVLHILPGVYTMQNALYLHPNLTVRGSGPETVLKKAAGVVTHLVRDSDWYEARVEVEDPGGFAVGCGVMLRSYKDGTGRMEVVKDTVTAVEGNVISLSRRMIKNMWLDEKATIAAIFPILTAGELVNDVQVEDLVLDGNRKRTRRSTGIIQARFFCSSATGIRSGM